MKHLNINDIASNNEKRNEKRRECFDKVLEQCYKRVEKSAKLDNIGCFFDVPEFVIGYPLFSLNECILHVYNKLVQNGFQVQYIFPRILYVSWASVAAQSSVATPQSKKPVAARQLTIEHKPAVPRPQTTRAASPERKAPVPQRKVIQNKKTTKSIAEFKPSGKFVLNLS